MATRHEARALLTIPQAARLLHVSDDTLRRQIREGDLEAVQIGTTHSGRARYRVLAEVIETRLGRSTLQTPPALERLQQAFATLTADQQETLIFQAVEWARAQAPALPGGPQRPEPTREEIARRFPELTSRSRAS